MPHYFAEFKKFTPNGSEPQWVRHDTRIYLHGQETPPAESTGVCIGIVIGKNPGSATRTRENGGFIEITEDSTLRIIKGVFAQSYVAANKLPPVNGYILVLNLFYLANKDLKVAIKEQKALLGGNLVATSDQTYAGFPEIKINDPAESLVSDKLPVWVAWGRDDGLNSLKPRFLERLTGSSRCCYDDGSKAVVGIPTEMAHHPMFLPHHRSGSFQGIVDVLKTLV